MTAPLRVLHTANQAGLLRLFMLPVCRAMRRSGAQVEIACMADGPSYAPLQQAGFVVHGLHAGGWGDPMTWLRVYRQVRGLLREGRYDLIVAHTPVMSWIVRYAARSSDAAVVYMAHGLPFAPCQSPLVRAALRRVERAMARYTDALLVMNRTDVQAAGEYRLSRAGRFYEIPGVGVDVAAWSPPLSARAAADIDRQFSLDAGRPLVLYLGRFIRSKRPGDLLELARRAGGKAQFLMAGEGPLWPNIHRQAQAIGPHVHVTGWTDQANELIRRCDLVAFPSMYREGLPRLLLEAQAAGKPVVAFNVRGSADAVDDGRTGLMIAPGDKEAFCQACLALLEDPQRRRKMGQAGQEWVAGRFDLPRSIAAQLRALSDVLQEKGRPCPWQGREETLAAETASQRDQDKTTDLSKNAESGNAT